MRRWLFSLALLAGLLALAACAAREEALPQEGPAPAAPQAAPAAQPGWEQEWERVLVAAKREGRVALMGPGGADVRRALTEPFEKRYGITVEFMGGRGPEFMERLVTERGAGKYLWDILVGGLSHWIPHLERGFLDPIEPVLILPEVKEPKSWRGGNLLWLDNEKRILAMTLSTSGPTFINPNLVKADEIKSYKDLLDPKWKGRILSDDPTIAGAAQSHYHFMFRHPELGPDFLRALAQQVVLHRGERRQQFEWLAAGRFPILVGGSTVTAEPLIREGLPIKTVDPTTLREGGSVAIGNGHLFLVNRAPHPNAAKVFINWLLTKEGQDGFQRGIGNISLRADVPTDHVQPWELPQERFLKHYGIEVERGRQELARFVTDLFGAR